MPVPGLGWRQVGWVEQKVPALLQNAPLPHLESNPDAHLFPFPFYCRACRGWPPAAASQLAQARQTTVPTNASRTENQST